MYHSLGDRIPECVRHHVHIRGHIWCYPPEVPLCIPVYSWGSWITSSWISYFLHFLGKFPEEFHCQVWSFHLHQPNNCLLTVVTEPFQGFTSSSRYFSLQSWETLQLLFHQNTSIKPFPFHRKNCTCINDNAPRQVYSKSHLSFSNGLPHKFLQDEVNLRSNFLIGQIKKISFQIHTTTFQMNFHIHSRWNKNYSQHPLKLQLGP